MLIEAAVLRDSIAKFEVAAGVQEPDMIHVYELKFNPVTLVIKRFAVFVF